MSLNIISQKIFLLLFFHACWEIILVIAEISETNLFEFILIANCSMIP